MDLKNTNTHAEIKDLMNQNNIIMVYNGVFSQDVIKSILKCVEQELADQGVEELLKRKIFNVMVEMLQNVTKHQMEIASSELKPIFLMSDEAGQYGLITGNFIAIDKIDKLKSQIDKINQLDAAGLKALYKEARLNSRISDVGGAGLGFIDMARKTGNPLEYDFVTINHTNYQYFTLKTKLNAKINN